ncbi:hypothetical protein [Sphingobacterium daejeonense]|uniref:hypothetical protein n=1 Tax=Sphingobacterium daejeonense TaxID=371142 RepID=UPI0010C3DCCA|nr:hypothetical protein [Sphingobacterium daejeonense]VTP97045.1 Uncharacterised protein [Sphingobacterium daejeonense]
MRVPALTNFVLSIPDRNIHISLFSNRDDQKIVSFIDDLLKELDIQIKGLEGKSVFNWLSRAYMNEFLVIFFNIGDFNLVVL